MKTREELEAMGFTVLMVNLLVEDEPEHDDAADAWRTWARSGGDIFTPGHEPVGKAGRAVLKAIEDGYEPYLHPRDSADPLHIAVAAYRDSLRPPVPEFEGWERKGEKYTKGAASVWMQCGNRYVWELNHERDAFTGHRDTLPEAIKAANDMLRLFEPVDTELAEPADPNPWRKTDGMSPPEEAGDRVIETVDGQDNIAWRYPATSAVHGWGKTREPELRPIKWRYADTPK